MDDASRRLMHLLFVPSQSTDGYLKPPEGYLETYRCQVASYLDSHLNNDVA